MHATGERDHGNTKIRLGTLNGSAYLRNLLTNGDSPVAGRVVSIEQRTESLIIACDQGGTSVAVAINPLRPNNDLSKTSHCNIKGLLVS